MKFIEKLKIDLIVDGREASRKALLGLLEENKDAKMLDLGCGDSRRLTNKVVQKLGTNTEVHGIDLHWANRDGGIKTYQADLNEALPVSSSYFDIVVASQVIEHLWNTDGFIKEIRRALSPGGYALISTPNLASWINVLYLILGKQPEPTKVSEEMYPDHERPGHLRVFTLKELKKFLRFHGLRIEKVKGSGYPPFTGSVARFLSWLDKGGSSTVTVKVRREGHLENYKVR